MMITNLFQSPFQQAVLMNYTTQPFLQRHTGHTNVQESHLIAQTFHALGYRVDVVDFCDETPLDLSPYQLLFGFGQAFERSFTHACVLRNRRPRVTPESGRDRPRA
jgi:hypothetical protein